MNKKADIGLSFASLVKHNNGYFKSDKQAAFLLDHVNGKDNTLTGSVYGNSFTLFYLCDSQGVHTVEKYTPHTGKTVVTWTRAPQELIDKLQAAHNEVKRLCEKRRRVEDTLYQRAERLKDARQATIRSMIGKRGEEVIKLIHKEDRIDSIISRLDATRSARTEKLDAITDNVINSFVEQYPFCSVTSNKVNLSTQKLRKQYQAYLDSVGG